MKPAAAFRDELKNIEITSLILSFVERSSATDVELWLCIRSDNSEEAFTLIKIPLNQVHNLSQFWGIERNQLFCLWGLVR